MVRRCDQAARLYVKSVEHRCIVCGSTKNLQCGHLFTRSKFSVRWDTDNIHAQCAGCNLRHEYDPHPYTMKFINLYGLERYQALYERAEKPRKFSLDDLELIAMRLEELAKLNERKNERRTTEG